MTIDGLMNLLIDINEGENPKLEYHIHDNLRKLVNAIGGLESTIAFLYDIGNAEEYNRRAEK